MKDGAEVKGIKIKQKVRMQGKTKKIGTVKTNPLKKDTDADGINDGTEVKGYKIKQRVITSLRGKKIKSYRIGKVQSDPTKKDTDKDGLKDNQERTGSKNKRHKKHKTSPVNWDTDFGAVSDGKEIRKKADPADARSGPKNPRL
ncbi:hypothetical protein ASG90_08630 [Nocardioides sp. Soil797]|nr:hypothetical protein ASG90_08630 [Nocardioides sp. Soil797]